MDTTDFPAQDAPEDYLYIINLCMYIVVLVGSGNKMLKTKQHVLFI